MKKIATLIALPLTFASAAFAADFQPVVKINSFYTVGGNRELGEVCGIVLNNDNTSVKLNVTADPNTSNPGKYHTFTGNDGIFCELIHTYTGTVAVEISGGLEPPAVTAKIGSKRN